MAETAEPKRISSVYFYAAALIFLLPGLYVVHSFSSNPFVEQLETLAWNLAPVLIAVVLYVSRLRAAAWGWLIAIGITMYIVVIAVLHASSANESIALFWAPIWNILIVGPVGLTIG